MNLVFDTEKKELVRMTVDENSTFDQIDDALHHHEKPYYHWCSRGIGENPDDRHEWREERERLYKLWYEKCPYRTVADPAAVKGSTLIQRLVRLARKGK